MKIPAGYFYWITKKNTQKYRNGVKLNLISIKAQEFFKNMIFFWKFKFWTFFSSKEIVIKIKRSQAHSIRGHKLKRLNEFSWNIDGVWDLIHYKFSTLNFISIEKYSAFFIPLTFFSCSKIEPNDGGSNQQANQCDT